MYSTEKEYVKYLSTVDTNAANGNVDEWLLLVESSMIESIRCVIEKSFEEYEKIRREEWVLNRCGQAVLCMSMTYWTSETERAFEKGGKAVREYFDQLNIQVKNKIQKVFFNKFGIN
jgi:dynein heavy chain, axonemal